MPSGFIGVLFVCAVRGMLAVADYFILADALLCLDFQVEGCYLVVFLRSRTHACAPISACRIGEPDTSYLQATLPNRSPPPRITLLKSRRCKLPTSYHPRSLMPVVEQEHSKDNQPGQRSMRLHNMGTGCMSGSQHIT